MESEQTKAQHAGVCYVFFRLFSGLREPYPFDRYVTLPDEEVNAAMEADAAHWLDENKAQVIEKLRKQSSRITGPYLNKPRSAPAAPFPLTFPQIARIAGWTYRECFDAWASRRFPILAVANKQEAVAVCGGLNHRHRQNPHPDSPRFGWLAANGFPPHEQLDIGVRIREAQSQSLHGEAAAAIHSLAAEALKFYAALQQPQAGQDGAANALDQDDTAFRPAKEIRERFDFQDQFELRRFLKAHPTIRTRLAKTKAGRDIPNRPLIHIGDVEAAKRSEPGITDPLDLPADKVDRAVAEVQRRKAEVDAQRLCGT
jgi:hypothetical protein